MTRGNRHENIVTNDDEIVVIKEKRYTFSKPILASRNCFGKVYFYEDGNIIFLKEDVYDEYKIIAVDEKLIDKVNKLYNDIANIMKKPINSANSTDIMIEYSRRNKIIKQMQKAIRRTIKLYYRCMK